MCYIIKRTNLYKRGMFILKLAILRHIPRDHSVDSTPYKQHILSVQYTIYDSFCHLGRRPEVGQAEAQLKASIRLAYLSNVSISPYKKQPLDATDIIKDMQSREIYFFSI